MTPAEGFRCSSERQCFFCKKSIAPGEAHRYIYPVPVPNTPLSVGALACLRCAPVQEAKQVELGLVARPEPRAIRDTAHA